MCVWLCVYIVASGLTPSCRIGNFGVQRWKPFLPPVVFLATYLMLSNVISASSNPLNASMTDAEQRYITLANIIERYITFHNGK